MIVNVDMFQNEHSLGVIGKRGENLATEIICNCGDPPIPHDDIRYECVCIRDGDAHPYLIPVEVIEEEDGNVSLLIALTSYETYRIGTLKLEFRMLVQTSDDSEAVIKSALFVGDIVPGIVGEVDEPGMPVRDALDRLDAEIARVQELAESLNNGSGNAGGGGSGERFVVNISYTGVVNDNAYGGSAPESFFDDTSCDKTVAEIKAAYDAGKNVVAVITITATGGEYEGSTFVKYAPLTRVEVLNMEWGNETRAYFGTSWTGYHHGYESGAGSYTTISTAYDALVLADDEDDPLQIEVGNPFVEYRRE